MHPLRVFRCCCFLSVALVLCCAADKFEDEEDVTSSTASTVATSPGEPTLYPSLDKVKDELTTTTTTEKAATATMSTTTKNPVTTTTTASTVTDITTSTTRTPSSPKPSKPPATTDTEITTHLVPTIRPPAGFPKDVPTGSWVVTEPGQTNPCLMARFGLVLIVPYETAAGMVVNGTVVVPPSAVSNGTCGALVLSWPSSSQTMTTVAAGNTGSSSNHLTMTFERGQQPYDRNNDSNKDVYFKLATVTAMLTVDEEHFPGAVNPMGGPIQMTVDHPWNYMSAPVNKSYRCDNEWMVAANSTTPPAMVLHPTDGQHSNGTGIFAFRNLQVQPYMPTNASNEFGTAVTCAADKRGGGTSSKVVPVAVGISLAALVLVVIAAYVVGRRRSRRRGYGMRTRKCPTTDQEFGATRVGVFSPTAVPLFR